MKAELNDTLKVIFYAQYYGQKIFDSDTNMLNHPVFYPPNFAVESRSHACLRRLTSMTDEEAIEIAKRVGHLIFPVSTGIKLYWKVQRSDRDGSLLITEKYNTSEVTIDPSDGQILIYERDEDGQHVSALCEDLWGYQMMLSMGFALPFMGYMVHELEEAGWIKLV